jgi:hypothetical protein
MHSPVFGRRGRLAPLTGRPGRPAPARHRWPAACAAAVATVTAGVAAVSVFAPPVVSAAGATGTSFTEVFDRARLVVVGTVVAAPPADPAYRLSVEAVLKGPDATELEFPGDATSVTLVPGTRVVVLAMDPRSLDFRGTWTLAVAPDGTIDPDGLSGAPRTVGDLLATFGAHASSPAGPGVAGTDAGTQGGTPTPGGGTEPWLVWAGTVAVVAVLAMLVAAGMATAARRRRRAS